MIVLVFIAVTLPYTIAFVEQASVGWQVCNYVVDFSFLVDLVLTFFTAIHDTSTNTLICDKKAIAVHYLSGWFVIDVIAILPFELMLAHASWKTTHAA